MYVLNIHIKHVISAKTVLIKISKSRIQPVNGSTITYGNRRFEPVRLHPATGPFANIGLDSDRLLFIIRRIIGH